MRRLVVACVLVSSTAQAGRVATWTETGSSDLDPAVVHGKLTGTTATFTARYLVPIERGYAPQKLSLSLPARGLVVGATATVDGATQRLQLVDANLADDRFTAAGAEDGTGAPPWAVLLAGGSGNVQVGIAAPHGGLMSLTLEISAPTCFVRDMRFAAVPSSWAALDFGLRAHIVDPTADTQADEGCGGFSAAGSERYVGFPVRELASLPAGERFGVIAGRLPLGEDHIVKLEIDVSTVMSEVPRDLATVILVDASRSLSAAQLEAQRAVVLAYLKGAPTSRVQVVAFARTARPLLPTWSVASQATPRLQRELDALAQRNGSNLDIGISEAGAWLGRITGTRRLVVITDEQLADRLSSIDPATLRTRLPAGTLVHVVALDDGNETLMRGDDTFLAPLARVTEGLPVRVGTVDDPPALDATMLLRPITLDHLTITAPGWKAISPDSTATTCGNEDALDEGNACTWWGDGTSVSGPVSVEALLWNKRITRVLRPDPTQAVRVARELSALGTLAPAAQERADLAARAVNAATSLYAQWGGHGSFGDDDGFITGGVCGCDSIGSSSHDIGVGSIGRITTLPSLDLKNQLEHAVAACKIDRHRVDISIEMTTVEIVDVHVTVVPRMNMSPAAMKTLESCVTEALWDASPMLPSPRAHATYAVTLGAGF